MMGKAYEPRWADINQTDPADTLETDDLRADPLDTGYVPPDRYHGSTAYGITAAEAMTGETLDARLGQEEPDQDVDDDPQPTAERAGRLAPAVHDDQQGSEQSVAVDLGFDGASSAEEAAVHYVE